MKKALLILILGIAWSAPRAAWGQHLQVEFSFGYRPFDITCENWTKQSIPQAWYDELRVQLPTFRAEWNKEASVLLGETVAALNTPFRRNELTAFLTLCSIQSMSTPLIINARLFLAGPMNGNPWPIARFAPLVFHEILHTHLPPLYFGKSQLLQKYEGEAPVVKNHLHLFSLMKHVYLKLGREQQLTDIVATDSSGKDPSYARAWGIVNQLEGHEPFIKEMRAK